MTLLVVGLALVTAVFASLFRGKELDRAYQDRVMREIHSRTGADETVWSGAAWAVSREPAYRFWFLPELARQLVINRHAEPFVMSDPPAAIVLDHNALVWLTQVQRELIPYVARHYIPVWRELLVPAMNGRLETGQRIEWVVPRSGVFRLYASQRVARHPWFRDPIGTVAYKGADASRLTTTLDARLNEKGVEFTLDGRPFAVGETIALRAGQRVSATSRAVEPIGVVLLSSGDRLLFRQPPPGVSIDAERPRVTHWPDFSARIAP